MRPDKAERIKFKVDFNQDTDFSAYARLLQSKWREIKNYPHGTYGNFLPAEFARKEKVNFLTEKIQSLATYELFRKGTLGKLMRDDRMWENLLSSQPLCFNLFGELHFDLKLATKYFKMLFPDRIDKVTDILFEHSPGRGNIKYTGDRSAFDVFVEYSKEQKKGFIGIEVKYAESLKEEDEEKAANNYKEQYATITNTSGFFKPNSIDHLRKPPIAQIWRDHLLCLATRQDYDEGFFVFLYPQKNSHCQKGVETYKAHLASENEKDNLFYSRFLDDFISTLSQVTKEEWATELKTRYLGVEN